MFTYLINPQKISLQTIRTEIAKAVDIAVENIKRFEYWPHQIWVHIEGVGGRLVSYRSLPTYMYQAFLAVKNCRTSEQLWELGQLFKLETKGLSQYYYDEDENANKYLEKLRSAWAYKRDDVQIKERLEAPMKKHRQEAQEWLETWQKIIDNCRTIPLLQNLYPNMKDQSQQFADLPEIIDKLRNSCRQRCQELKNVSKKKI